MLSSTLRPASSLTSKDSCLKTGFLKPSALTAIIDSSHFSPQNKISISKNDEAKSGADSAPSDEKVPATEKSEVIPSFSLATPSISKGFVFGEDLSNKVQPPPTNEKSANGDSTSASECTKSVPEVVCPPQISVVHTGEENERHILQLSCKALMYDKATSQWIQRGPCFIRLNDLNPYSSNKSRLILRTSGNMRVLFNTYVTSDMLLVMEGERCVRVSALEVAGEQQQNQTGPDRDPGSSPVYATRVFSLVLSASDAKKLFAALTERKRRARNGLKRSSEVNKTQPSESPKISDVEESDDAHLSAKRIKASDDENSGNVSEHGT